MLSSLKLSMVYGIICFTGMPTLLFSQSNPTSFAVNASITCIGCSVTSPSNAVGSNMTDFAAINVPIGIISTITLELTFAAPQPPGTVVSLWLEDPTTTLDLLTDISYDIYNNASLVGNSAWGMIPARGSATQTIIYATALSAFNKIHITLAGVLSISKSLRVFGAGSGIVPLPVGIVSFKARNIPDAVELLWKTSVIREKLFFEIERSKDSKKWSVIGKIAAPSENFSGAYTYLDKEPYSGINYYRMSISDDYHCLQKTNTISITAKTFSEDVGIYPNPVAVNDILHIDFRNNPDESSYRCLFRVTWLTPLGIKYFQQISMPEEKGSLNIPAGILPGVYRLEIETESSKYIKSVVVR